MATKRTIKKEKKSVINFIKSGVSNINDMVFETSKDLAEGMINTTDQWQTVLAKSVKKGTTLLGKQQDLVFTGLELLKGQYKYSNKRITKLLNLKPLGFDQPELKVKEPVAKVKTAVKAKTKKVATKVVKAVKPTVNKAATKVEKTAAKVVKATTPVVKKATTKVEKPVAKVEKIKPVSTPTDLSMINGIGPKLQEILNKAGITNLDQMAAATKTQLTKIMTEAGPRYERYDTSKWVIQAKVIIADKTK